MKRTTTRRFTAIVALPAATAGILLGGLAFGGQAIAGAQPADSQCAGMTMTSGQGGANPGALTRAGQVGAAAAPSASDGAMAVNCQPVGHS